MDMPQTDTFENRILGQEKSAKRFGLATDKEQI